MPGTEDHGQAAIPLENRIAGTATKCEGRATKEGGTEQRVVELERMVGRLVLPKKRRELA